MFFLRLSTKQMDVWKFLKKNQFTEVVRFFEIIEIRFIEQVMDKVGFVGVARIHLVDMKQAFEQRTLADWNKHVGMD